MKTWSLAALSFLVMVIAVACGQPQVQSPTPVPREPATPAQSLPPRSEVTPAVPTAGSPAPKAAAASQAPYYEGKTIEIIVDSAAGGGTDATARITAPFLSKQIPGNPKIIVRNFPGAAGSNANNIFTQRTKPDGLTLLQNSSSTINMQLRARDIAQYDLRKYKYVGNVYRAESILMIRKGTRARLTDPKAPPLVIGTKEGEESWQAMPMWGREFLGWNVRWVIGYGGTSEVELAFRRGELDMFATINSFMINRLAQEGLTENLSVIGSLKTGKFVRRADFPDVPTFEEMLGDKKPGGISWQAYLVCAGPLQVDKFLVAPPGTPDNIVSILNDGYAKMAKDPQFDQMAKKVISDVYDVGSGKDVEALVKSILDTPPEALSYFLDLQRKFGIIK